MENSDALRFNMDSSTTLNALHRGLVIPACPLALNSRRKWDVRRQRALFRYYLAAGAGGLAVGVHTTQFAIRDPKIGLFQPVLQLAIEELGNQRGSSKAAKNQSLQTSAATPIGIAGICGETKQALAEAKLIRDLGFDAGLLSLAALQKATDAELITHCHSVSESIPLIGFYLQPAVGGLVLSYSFWRRFA